MYITYKDLIWQLSNKIVELSKLQNELILNNLDDEANEEDKEKFIMHNNRIGGII